MYSQACRKSSIFFVACIAVLSLLTSIRAVSAAGDRVMETSRSIAASCELMGGTAEIEMVVGSDDVIVGTYVTCSLAVGGFGCDVGGSPTSDPFVSCSPGRQVETQLVASGPGDTADPGSNPRDQTTVLDDNSAPAADSAEDPTREKETTAIPMAMTDEVVLACESLGGVATVDTHGGIGYTNVHCRGGVLDGTTCIVGHYDTYCTYFRVTTDQAVLDGITPDTAPDLIEDPTWEGEVVVFNQSGPTVDSAAMQTALCGLFGGTGKAGYDFDEEGNETESRSSCTGGLLDGMLCQNYPDQSICLFMGVAPDPVEADSPAGNEIPAESAPVVPSPTVMPTQVVDTTESPTATVEPTVAPTDAPVEPTAGPTNAPPPPPQNDNAVPPGEAEDPVVEPTPTPVTLL